MFPLKALVLCSLLFTWAWCLNMRNNAPGVNSEEKSDDEAAAADDDYSIDKEERTIQTRMAYNKLSDDDIETISSKIWKSVPGLQVQYDGKLQLFSHNEKTDKAIDKPFKDLFPFYEKETGKEDPCVNLKFSECDKAQNDFLDHIFNGKGPIRVLYDRLKSHGIFKDKYRAFKTYLKTMWFEPYSRSGGAFNDSSAFEHVFLGEIKNGEVAGLHNWMRMYDDESSNYFKLNTEPKDYKKIVANVQFKWHKIGPKWSSFFTRTSPATEIALYTLCFMTQPDNECQIKLDNTLLHLKTYTWKNTTDLIGSAYPVFPRNPLIAAY